MDSLLVAMSCRVGPEPSPRPAAMVAKRTASRLRVSPERIAGPTSPLRQSRAQGGSGAELGDRVLAQGKGVMDAGLSCQLRSQANRGLGVELSDHVDRVEAEPGFSRTELPTQKKKAKQEKPQAVRKRPASKDTAQREKQKRGGDGSEKPEPKKAAKASKKAAIPSTPPRSKSRRTNPASPSPRPTCQTSPASSTFASSPVSKELRDALPGPISINDLCQPAALHLASLSKQIGAATLAKRIGEQTWILHTACSGLGCPEIAGEAIQVALRSLPEFRDVTFKIVHGIKIDKNPAAQATLQANFPDSCLFSELENLLEGHARTFARMRLKTSAECIRHGKDCPLPTNDTSAASAMSGVTFVVMIAGPPCNPWSKRGLRTGNDHTDAFAHVIWAKMVVQGPYEIVLFENVVDEELIKNLHKHFSQHFDILVSVVSADKLGYPVSRKRMYALMLRKGKCVWKSDLSLQEVMDVMQRTCRMSLEQLWFLRSNGLAEYADWDPDLSGWENLTPGQRRYAEVYQRLHHVRRVWDLSQNPDVAPRFETGQCLMTLLTNTMPFCVAKQRALAPAEAMVAHGIPAVPQVTPPGMRTWKFPVSQGEMRKMAGMSMHVPSVAGVMLAAMTFVEKTS